MNIDFVIFACGLLAVLYWFFYFPVRHHKLAMKKFERMINTNDEALSEELVAPDAAFYTPASPEPLYGGKGYLSVVKWMRGGFSDVQWKLEEMVAEGNVIAVR